MIELRLPKVLCAYNDRTTFTGSILRTAPLHTNNEYNYAPS